MKKSLTLLLILVSLNCLGQREATLPEYGNTLAEIIPDGWKVLDSISGDLNRDTIPDLVFAIQNTDKNYLEVNDGLGADTIDLNPRILGIYFGSKSGKFHKELIAEDFIILRDSPVMEEPFVGFSLNKKGVLDITFHIWYSAGSWMVSNHTYRFRFQDDQFTLIGYDSNETHRGTGASIDHSINFLTGKIKVTKENFDSNDPKSVQWKKFKMKELYTLQTLKKPLQSEIKGITF